jgi:DMSO/TMAO reductase YedYZ molybdopterin-dependent catalytic subunit
MNRVSRGFLGRRRKDAPAGRVPPGQYLTDGFPILAAGPTPRVDLAEWRLSLVGEIDEPLEWSWDELQALPQEQITVDIHCVTKWSKLDTGWVGVSLDTLLADVDTSAEYVLARSYGGYTTNLPLADVSDGKAWIAHTYDGEPLDPEHGGPARLLVPHLYFWKSAKWVREIELRGDDEPGFWEGYGYHSYGDPWREQRYAGD